MSSRSMRPRVGYCRALVSRRLVPRCRVTLAHCAGRHEEPLLTVLLEDAQHRPREWYRCQVDLPWPRSIAHEVRTDSLGAERRRRLPGQPAYRVWWEEVLGRQ